MRLMTVLLVVLGLLALLMSGCGTQEETQAPAVPKAEVEEAEKATIEAEKEAEEALEAAKEEAAQIEKKAEEEVEKAKDAARNLLQEEEE